MTKIKQYNANLNAKYTPYIWKRDYPELYEDTILKLQGIEVPREYQHEQTCCFCEQRFFKDHPYYKKTPEHLDNNNKNNEPWNICYAHWICNEKKKFDPDLQITAAEILERNKKWHEINTDFDFVGEREKLTDIENQDNDEKTEIEYNVAHREIMQKFLLEKLQKPDSKHLLTDAVYCITLRCQNKTGHGSPQATRNYLKTICCSEGKYDDTHKEGGKRYITWRTGQ